MREHDPMTDPTPQPDDATVPGAPSQPVPAGQPTPEPSPAEQPTPEPAPVEQPTPEPAPVEQPTPEPTLRDRKSVV